MPVVFAAAAGVVALAAIVAVARHRRSAARGSTISLPARSRPGLSHLAAGVSELSDLGLHLRAGPPRRSLGTLLGSGSAASR